MSGEMDGIADLAKDGFYLTTAAGCLIPVAFACAGQMYPMIGDPGQLLDAGLAWFDAADQINDALNGNEDLTSSIVATGWTGNDADAFTDKAADFSRQLMTTMLTAYAVGTILVLAALSILLVSLVIFAMGVGFGLWAAAILAAMASVVGFLGPVEALELSAELYALECEAALMELDATLSSVFNVGAGVLGTILGADVGLQTLFGDEEALGDLVQGTVVGIPTITAGIAAAFFSKKIGEGMKPPFGNNLFRGLGIVIQGSNVDPVGLITENIDPTRWHVGG